MNLTDFLTQVMGKNDTNQSKLAKKLELTQPHVSLLINGKRAFTSELLTKFIYTLNMNEEEVLTFKELTKSEPLITIENTILLGRVKHKILNLFKQFGNDTKRIENEIKSLTII